jgi:triacylglycerol esterase/lipase EstA (alpha/beta hydrolase family)
LSFALLQFLYVTQDGTTTLYQKLKENLMDSTKKKVVLIAHSQGGIITSLILDALLADLPQVECSF